jgi:hypothetical protein
MKPDEGRWTVDQLNHKEITKVFTYHVLRITSHAPIPF